MSQWIVLIFMLVILINESLESDDSIEKLDDLPVIFDSIPKESLEFFSEAKQKYGDLFKKKCGLKSAIKYQFFDWIKTTFVTTFFSDLR